MTKLTGFERAEYLRKRREGWGALSAYYHATRDKGGPDVPLEDGERFERDGYSLRLSLKTDEWFGTGDANLGEFRSAWVDGCLDRKVEGFPPGRNEHPYFLPGITEAEHIKGGAERADAARYARADLARAEGFGVDWVYLSILVSASKQGIELGSASVCGVEDDSGKRYLRETISELASEAISEAADALASLVSAEQAG